MQRTWLMAADAPVKSNDDDIEALRRVKPPTDRGRVPVVSVMPTLWRALGRGRWEGGRELVAGGATLECEGGVSRGPME